MMNKISCLLLTLTLSAVVAHAQTRTLNSGIIAYDQGKPGEAIQKIEEAFQNKEEVKYKKQPKGYLWLAKAYLQVGTDTTLTELRAMYPDALLKAKESYEQAMNHEESRRIENNAKLEGTEGRIFGALFNDAAVPAFNDGNYDKSAEYFSAAADLQPDHFMTHRMLGATYILMQDTAQSVENLQKSLDIFEDRYLGEGKEKSLEVYKQSGEFQNDSTQLSYIFQQLAVIYDAQGKPRKALETIERGLEMMGPDRDLKRQELNIYNNNPELLEDAKSKFEAAIAEDPNDLPIKLAYASLLERNGETDKALELYREAYEQDPDNLQANYGLGAYYVNQAAELSQEKADLKKEAEIAEMNEKILDLLEKGYPYMKKLHELQPTELEWLRQLVTITGNIGKDEEMEMYGKKLGELNK
jgi:tetratricopeptide (TPR) repeat protein